MKFWFPDIPGFYWSAIFLAIIFAINAMTVKGFGESEFLFSLVKVIAIIVFIIIGLAMIVKIMLTPDMVTFGNWTKGEAPFVGGLQAMIGVAMIADSPSKALKWLVLPRVNPKIRKRPFLLRSNKSSGVSCYFISCVFLSSVR